MVIHLCCIEVYENPAHIFYVNLYLSQYSGKLESLVLWTRIILNDFLFEIFFETKFSGVIPFTNGTWTDNFKVSFDETKKVVFDPVVSLSNFGPLSLLFNYRILAQIIASILIPQKGSLSNVTC